MRKTIYMLVAFLLILLITVGCSNSQQNNTNKQWTRGEPVENDLSKGFSYKIDNGDLKLTYDNTGNTVTLIKAFEAYEYFIYTETGTDAYTDHFPEVIEAQLCELGGEIYFSVASIQGIGIATYFIELETMDIYFIGQGLFAQEVRMDRFNTLIVLESGSDYYARFPRGGGDYYHLGNRLESDILAQIERALQEDSAVASMEGAIKLSTLINGDNVGGGLTIKDINYEKNHYVSLTLAGQIRVTGEISYDDMMWDAFYLYITEDNNLPTIDTELGTYPIHYKPRSMRFVNEDDLINAIPAQTLNEIKGGMQIDVEITIRDISAWLQYESERHEICEFVDLKILP